MLGSFAYRLTYMPDIDWSKVGAICLGVLLGLAFAQWARPIR